MNKILRIFAIVATMIIAGCRPDNPTPEPGGGNEQKESFYFSEVIASDRMLSLNIHSNNPDMEYIVLLAEKKHFLINGIDSLNEMLSDDYQYISSLASAYEMSIADFVRSNGILAKGDYLGYLATGLYPATEYVVYCYGIDLTDNNYRALTEVCYTIVSTESPEMQSVEFDIECQTNGNAVDISIDPKEYNGYYYYYIVPEGATEYLAEGEVMDSVYTEIFSNRTFNLFERWINDEGKFANDFCQKGKISFLERVKPNTRYMVAAFAVSDDSLPMLCSVPEVAYFTAGEFTKSELTLRVEVEDITAYNAQLTITPSNNDETYACVLIARSQQPKDVSDYEQMQLIISQFDPAVFTGPISQALTPLMPATEYVVLAFGIDQFNNLPTTDLYELHFTSREASAGTASITSIELVKLFDAQAIMDIEPSYAKYFAECECVGIVEAKTNVPCDKLYFWWYEGWMKVEYTDEAFLEDLLMYDYADNPEVMDMYYSLGEDDLFFFAGIAEDEDGNLSDIYYGEEFLLSEDMVSPAEEFFAMIAEPSTNRYIIKR